jgi:hypothetical protein
MEHIEVALSSEDALLCAAGLRSVGEVRMLPIAVDAVLLIVADAAGKHSGLQRLSDRSLDGGTHISARKSGATT